MSRAITDVPILDPRMRWLRAASVPGIEVAGDARRRHADHDDRAHRADERVGAGQRRRCAGGDEHVVGHHGRR